jgi:16S rRNA (adenine1518-N6/adenine1519-N6)-dimethyltransferase
MAGGRSSLTTTLYDINVTCTMTSPKTLLKGWNIRAKKRMGQNFLVDPSTAEMIVARSGIAREDIVLEIGAGLGALTIPAARMVRKVYAVEKDPQLLRLLQTELKVSNISNVELIEKNFLNFDVEPFAAQISKNPIIMSNLPYNISSQVLIKLIHCRNSLSRAILMFQKELATRLTAQPNCKAYGRLTAMLQYSADIRSLAHIDANLFFPKPNVDSEVLEITFKKRPKNIAADEEFLFKVIKAAFGQRRKTLKNSLAGSELRISDNIARHALEQAGIDPSRRAETLNVVEFETLSRSLARAMAINK